MSIRHLAATSRGIDIIRAKPSKLAHPATDLLSGASLFLDLDGTLFDIVADPALVRADAALERLLVDLAERLDGRLAIVSGRSLEQVDAMLGDCAQELAVSGSHGCEHRWRGIHARPDRPASLDVAAERLGTLAAAEPRLLLEHKSFGVALHYRAVPEAEGEVRELAAQLAQELDLALQPGKMMVELRVSGGDKGLAVERLMRRPPMRGTVPVFIGDDVTDEPGFEAALALNGHAILVGEERPTAARYRLPNPAEVRAWLADAVTAGAAR
ncbi:trehalose-phosphatase [Novosphingobium sp. JCM 18896]|uniref:trehalose-phosphatase n=1 Tax=Novosphingobium sp. JCM 18896 TaxID=2989731 RepID=UPI002221B539|nr:trehalose-phosphatase [Novosphingobium sp. JCM 18896]MCW1431652.1 trehalose-phosphatase [Novosphingobium sp. JCM 18896]